MSYPIKSEMPIVLRRMLANTADAALAEGKV
jgi:hypothetical protein